MNLPSDISLTVIKSGTFFGPPNIVLGYYDAFLESIIEKGYGFYAMKRDFADGSPGPTKSLLLVLFLCKGRAV